MVLSEWENWEPWLIVIVTSITFIGRGITVLGLTAGFNCTQHTHKHMSLRSQAVMTAAGLRGGTAYALAMRWDGDAGRIGPVETLTMGIIMVRRSPLHTHTHNPPPHNPPPQRVSPPCTAVPPCSATAFLIGAVGLSLPLPLLCPPALACPSASCILLCLLRTDAAPLRQCMPPQCFYESHG